MARNTSVLLGDHFEEFIAKQISSGRYNCASEVIRAALRLLEVEEQRKMVLNEALRIGEESGFEKNFTAKMHLKRLNAMIR